MKSTRLLICVLLVVVCFASWGRLLAGIVTTAGNVNRLVQQAEEYRSRRLYELSMNCYLEATEIQNRKSLYEDMLTVAEEFYAETHTSTVRNTLVQAYTAATAAYPKEVSFWERYAQLYIDAGSRSSAVRVLQSARNNGASSTLLTNQWTEIYYAVQTRYERYESLLNDGDSGFLATNNNLWGSLASDGSQKMDMLYTAVSPGGTDGETLCTGEDGENYLFDGNGTMIGRFTADIEEIRAYGDGLIPVKLVGRTDWCYLNELGEEQFGGFLQAGMFQGGRAAVQLDSGVWCLIGTDGQQSSNNTWQEVRLNERGAYLSDNRVLLKTDDTWGIYDSRGREQGHLTADDIDVCRDGYIAFQKSGRWGFADGKGNVVIEPEFDAARSFSGGVGAVCKDGAWGFVDEAGTLVLPYQFSDAAYFNSAGYCPVRFAEEEDYWRLITWSIKR